MKNLVTLVFIVAIINAKLIAQSDWMQVYFPDQDAIGNNFDNSYDEGIIIVGKHGHNYVNYNWLVKTNINGEILWKKTLGVNSTNIKISVISYNDIGELFLGGLTGFYNDDYDPIVIK